MSLHVIIVGGKTTSTESDMIAGIVSNCLLWNWCLTFGGFCLGRGRDWIGIRGGLQWELFHDLQLTPSPIPIHCFGSGDR